MGRELIYPGEKQIKALLSPARHHTIAYINILSWAIQVSKGLTHLHFHKGPLSTPWPPLLLCLSCRRVPAVFTTPVLLLLLPHSPICPFSTLCYYSCRALTLFQHLGMLIVRSDRANILIPLDTDVSLADGQRGAHREKQNRAAVLRNVAVIYDPVRDSYWSL